MSGDTITEIPRVWLSPSDGTQSKCIDNLKTCAKTGGNSLGHLKKFIDSIKAVDVSGQINVSPGSPMLATPGGGNTPLLSIVIVNMTDQNLQLTEKTYLNGEMLAYPVVQQYTDDTFTTKKIVAAPSGIGRTNSKRAFDSNGNDHIWIDSASTLGAGAASVGVFRYKSTAAPFWGVTVGMQFFGSPSFPHFYVSAERTIGGSSSASVGATCAHESAEEFFDTFVSGKERHTDSSGHCYCATFDDKANDHTIATFVAAR